MRTRTYGISAPSITLLSGQLGEPRAALRRNILEMSVLQAIGNTPLVPLANINGHKAGVRVLVKLEGNNPGGSIKDRPAYYMVKQAEETGVLNPSKTIVEATSGNTGIALAMIGAARGYRVKLFMPACVSTERQLILKSLGAEVILTPAHQGTDGAIMAAVEQVQQEPERYYMPNQFDNEANSLAHFETTAPEIYTQTGGEVDCIVAGMGTTGTIMGLARYFKEKSAATRVVGVEPPPGHSIQGLKNLSESRVPKIYVPALLDEKMTVADGEAFETARLLAVKEGIFVGMSSGAAVAAALKLARGMERGTVVAILPDRGDRYLSTTLFRSICAKCPP